MPTRCVAAHCGNIKSKTDGISLHTIPYFGDNRPEAVKRRRKWVAFVKQKRAKWEPSATSVICSKHFKPEDFTVLFPGLSDEADMLDNRSLKKDDLGINVFPSIHPVGTNVRKKPPSDRERRMSLKAAMSSHKVADPDEPTLKAVKVSAETPVATTRGETSTSSDVRDVSATVDPPDGPSCSQPTEAAEDENAQEDQVECNSCILLKQDNRVLKNRILTLQGHLKKRKVEKRKFARKGKQLDVQPTKVTCTSANDRKSSEGHNSETDGDDMEADDEGVEEVAEEEEEDGSLYETEAETTETETDDDDDGKSNRLSLKGKNLRSEPKHIVFLTQLLLLFRFCHLCKGDNPLVETSEVGTEVVIKTTCSNPSCRKQNTWYSQPLIPGTRIPAGNFLLCLSILLSGGSATKVFTMFSHMGLGCISLKTFFRYQRSKLFPTISIYWQKYQAKLLEKVKAIQGGVVVAGDGRHDSMGHSAKFGAYTIFCCTLPMILHFVLIQRNQAGSSPAMEFMGFKQCMDYLVGCGILITTFISDRHTAIASHMKKVLTNIVHYFDIWHLKKKIRKVLSKLAKEKGCEVLAEWIRPCENHLYWSASTTFSGNGKVMWAKFKTFLSHIINKHSSLADPLFNKCGHGEIHPRKWLHAGSVAYEKLCAALTNNSLMKGIQQASPFAQTSCLEGFHSLLNQFAPKMIAYSYAGLYCRHILAAVHFNFNLQREAKCRVSDGTERVRVSYPKFKNGEATVRDVRISPNFDYVEEIFQTYLNSSKDELNDAVRKLGDMAPAPMNTMLEKQPRQEAIEKRAKRAKMVVEDVPPTNTPETDQPNVSKNSDSRKRKRGTQKAQGEAPKKARYCSTCKHPMRGHQKVKDCPKNKN